tara:strand:+ start:47 stop:640 length:594 start_codon:yes stop_codon:yes gene_type:complete
MHIPKIKTGESKKCSKCGEVKLLDDFNNSKRNKTTGKYSACKICVSKQGKKYYEKVLRKRRNFVSREDINKIRYMGINNFLINDEAKKIMAEFHSIRYKSNNAQKIALLNHGEALCTKCGIVKKVNEFYKNIFTKSHHCKKCRKIQKRLNKETLSDTYIAEIIVNNTNLKIKDIPQRLIVAKRIELQMKRTLKESAK